jgi:hypothetical protein
MNENEKKEIARRLSARVSTGISFVELDYLPRHEKPDAAWIRNIYILLSFYAELLLKAIFVIRGNFASVDELEDALKKMGHNLETIGQQIGTSELLIFGIKKIQRTNPDYLIETNEGNFSVEDFIDIRYDFIDGKVRTLNGTEHEMFKKQIEIMHKINKVLKSFIY